MLRSFVRRATPLASFALVAGCYSSAPGVIHTSANNPIVSIGAGTVDLGNGTRLYSSYIVDRTARACWFFVYEAVAPLDCCAVARVPEARNFLTWMDPATCAGGTPAPVAAAPARSSP